MPPFPSPGEKSCGERAAPQHLVKFRGSKNWRENAEPVHRLFTTLPARGAGGAPGGARGAVRGCCGHVLAGGRGRCCGRGDASAVSASPSWQLAPARRHAEGKLTRRGRVRIWRCESMTWQLVRPAAFSAVRGLLGDSPWTVGAQAHTMKAETDLRWALNREI